MKYCLIHRVALICIMFFTSCVTTVWGEELTAFEGLIEPSEMVDVGTPVEGVVDNVYVQRSALVKKGEPLVQLESSVEDAVVDRSQALVMVDGEIKLQKERLAYAKRIYKRIEELFNAEAISAEKRDEAATEVQLAQARLQQAKENRMLAKLDLERARAMLNRRTIKSPLSGIVVERFVSPGEFVDNQPLLKLAQMDPLRVEVILPAEMLKAIQPGMRAEIKPESQADGNYNATVTIVDRVIDAASNTFGVRLELPNPDYQLPGGLRCTVHFLDNVELASPAEATDTQENGKIAKGSQPQPFVTTLAQ